MANTIRIKRRAAGGAPGAPASLANAELAFNEQDNTLYYGKGAGEGGSAVTIEVIGGLGAFTSLGTAQTITGAKTFDGALTAVTQAAADNSRLVATTAYVKSQPAPNDGTLGAAAGTAGVTNTTVALDFSGVYSANTATNVTVKPVVGPAINALVATMTGAGAGFLKKSAADTYTVDTNTYLTAESDTLASVTGRGATTSVNSTFSGGINMSSSKITNLAAPTEDTDAANKLYVDATRQGLSIKDAVRAATTADITLSGTQTVDGVALVADDRVLVKNQNTSYDAATSGGGFGAWKITDGTDGNAYLVFPNPSTSTAVTSKLSVGESVTIGYNGGFSTTTIAAALGAVPNDPYIGTFPTSQGYRLTNNFGITGQPDNNVGTIAIPISSVNGLYKVAVGAWTRTIDANAAGEISGGTFVFVQEGTANADSGWVCTNDGAVTLDTTAITFTQFSGAGQITAGSGLTKTGNTINAIGTADRITANANSIDIASTYVGQTSITTLGTITTGTWTGTTIAVANGGTGATTSTGSGAVVLANTPTLITPVLGTPGSGNFSTGTFTWPTFNQNTSGTAAGLSVTLAVASGGTGAVTLTGLVKGNGTSAFTAAVDGTDYLSPTTIIDGGTY